MIKHIWSVLCRRSIIDSTTNNLTISDVLEELKIDIKVEEKDSANLKVITLPLEFEVVSMWLKDRKDIQSHLKADCDIEVISPIGKTMQNFAQKIEMPAGMRRMRTILRVIGFAVEDSGEYTLKINIKEEGYKTYKTVAELPLEVSLNKEVVTELPKP